jgi:hypothetical protein
MTIDDVVSVCSGLNKDELRVVLRVAERMAKGRAQYGGLDLATDKRDHVRETTEELLDACAYLAMRTLQAPTVESAHAAHQRDMRSTTQGG